MSDNLFPVTSGFYDSVDGDRRYSADDMNQPYKSILTEGIFDLNEDFKVTAGTGLQVVVNYGKALVGTKWVDAAQTTITIPSNTSLYDRVDSVILRVNNNEDARAAHIIYRTGTPSSTPAAPALVTDSDIYELRIANVYVATGATNIGAGNITDRRGTLECPYVTFNVGAAQIEAILMSIIEDHPELITTVPDGGITTAKLADGAVTPVKLGGVIDDTLTVSGRAADAKKTGDEIINVKGALVALETILGFEQESFGTQDSFDLYTVNSTLTNVRFSAVASEHGGLLKSIKIKTNTAGNAYVYIGKVIDTRYFFKAKFQISCESGLHEYLNGTDFVYTDYLEVGSVIGITSDTIQIKYYEGTEKSYTFSRTNAETTVGLYPVTGYTINNFGVSISATFFNTEDYPIYNLEERVDFIEDKLAHKNERLEKKQSTLSNSALYLDSTPVFAIKKNLCLEFFATITTFNSLQIKYVSSNHNTDYNGITIDATNVILRSQFNASVAVYPHGLTIQNNISVLITVNYDLTASLILMSDGNIFTKTDMPWGNQTNRLTPAVVADSTTTLTDATLTLTCLDYRKAIYAYGDSYFNYLNSRWVYYVDQYGYIDNLLLNAYPGEASNGAITCFNEDMKHGNPTFVLWCMGMNDSADSSEAPATNWMEYTQQMITYCENNNIVPILATIPTIPTKSHEQKNAWIRSSGYRYIDFAKAVGADAEGNWYDGMLESGASPNEHPTVKGAKALFMQAITDFPEIMIPS